MRLPPAGMLGASASFRNVQLGRCAHCGAIVLGGLSDDFCAYPVLVELSPLTWPGELAAAILHGRETFTICHRKLRHRGAQLRTWAQTDLDVLAEHICGVSVPDAWQVQCQQSEYRAANSEVQF